ncbi:spermine synthase [Klebsormidium nitens]|uniref:thermospermine synthase n=1 Tax=Klebsormidium nitens TaxID=105231 RepID=A0A1Y1IA37_KLENI|nr:spermine synthase [Klebsormidium nitens]|eukprot:GAQ87780.1 spermine synthase [Klebsormidium nitens]
MSEGRRLWLEEELQDDLKWSVQVKSILYQGASKFQDIELIESGPFGKLLMLDGKAQSAEADEFVYHESLVHPALLSHPNPKKIFIMGGGEGSTAREALRHKSVEKVVMVDIDQVVVEFCRDYLPANKEAFEDPRLEVLYNDALVELERSTEQFDVIIGDLADPVEGGPCYKLYTKDFYEKILKPKLAPGGIIVTQGGPAGILSYKLVYSSIHNTLAQVFKHTLPYATHVPSFADQWGWIMASDEPLKEPVVADLDAAIAKRINGELGYLDGRTLQAEMALSKAVRKGLAAETHVYTEDDARFIHGSGIVNGH